MIDLYAVFVVVPLAREAVEQFHRELRERVGPGIPVVVSDSAAISFVDSVSEQLSTGLPEAPLSVLRIQMNSPGNITLVGLGEPIKQLREFIKDLWFQNHQEKQRGQLELLRQYLGLEREFGPLPPAAVDILAPKALRGIATLERLEAAGKLVELPTSLESQG